MAHARIANALDRLEWRDGGEDGVVVVERERGDGAGR